MRGSVEWRSEWAIAPRWRPNSEKGQGSNWRQSTAKGSSGGKWIQWISKWTNRRAKWEDWRRTRRKGLTRRKCERGKCSFGTMANRRSTGHRLLAVVTNGSPFRESLRVEWKYLKWGCPVGKCPCCHCHCHRCCMRFEKLFGYWPPDRRDKWGNEWRIAPGSCWLDAVRGRRGCFSPLDPCPNQVDASSCCCC